MMIESQSSLKHRDFNDKTKTLPVYKNGYPNLEMCKEEEHLKITKSIK